MVLAAVVLATFLGVLVYIACAGAAYRWCQKKDPFESEAWAFAAFWPLMLLIVSLEYVIGKLCSRRSLIFVARILWKLITAPFIFAWSDKGQLLSKLRKSRLPQAVVIKE